MRLAPGENLLSVRSHCGLKSAAVKGLRESSRILDCRRFKPQKLASMNRKHVKTGEKLTIEGYASRSGYYGEFGKKLLAVPTAAWRWRTIVKNRGVTQNPGSLGARSGFGKEHSQ